MSITRKVKFIYSISEVIVRPREDRIGDQEKCCKYIRRVLTIASRKVCFKWIMNNNSELNVFRLLRIARNKKVKEIAEELSITPAYVHAIESGKNFPSGRLLKDYAKVLGVDEKTIVNFKPDKKNNLVFENSLLRLLQIICKIGNSQE